MTSNPSAASFVDRHIGPSSTDVEAMLGAIGVDSLDELIDAAVPEIIRSHRLPDVGGPLSETEALAALRKRAAKNEVFTSFIGMGYYGTVTPGVIQRNILENPGWYTAYTPYQPEISQGRLEALLNYQTVVSDLTGLDLANASLLDEATAAAEAMTLLKRVGKSENMSFFVDDGCHPQTIEVVNTRATPLGFTVVVGDPETDLEPGSVFGALLQYPGTTGRVRDLRPTIDALHAAGALAAVATDLLACTLLTPPGEMGADVAIGSTQRFGVPMMFGGPHAAFMSTRHDYRRSMPGRLVGVSVDGAGRQGLRLTLQTREQHIRRDRATSNICTAQVLLAVMAGMYAVYHGPDGLTTIAEAVHARTSMLAQAVTAAGLELVNDTWFDTIAVRVADAEETLAKARHRKINLRQIDARTVGVSVDETTTDTYVAALCEILGAASPEPGAPSGIPDGMRRGSAFLEPPVPVRDRDAPLPAKAPGQGHRPRPVDDPARLVHDEAERVRRDAADHMAGVRKHPPLRPA